MSKKVVMHQWWTHLINGRPSTMESVEEGHKNVTYNIIRQWIGLMAFLLPIAVVIGGYLAGQYPWQPTVSDYYNSNMRDFFVGTLCAVSVFLICYKGYDKRDDLIADLIGLAGLGLAFFPVKTNPNAVSPVSIFQVTPDIGNLLHIVSAFVFFGLLGYYSIFIFTLTWKDEGIQHHEPDPLKKMRNMCYLGCGLVIWVSLLSVGLVSTFMDVDSLARFRIVYVLEACMLFAFGISWLIKGGFRGFLRSKKSRTKKALKVPRAPRTPRAPKAPLSKG